jgi:hypothetical protein
MSALNDLDAMVLRQEVYPPMTTKNAELTFTEWDDRVIDIYRVIQDVVNGDNVDAYNPATTYDGTSSDVYLKFVGYNSRIWQAVFAGTFSGETPAEGIYWTQVTLAQMLPNVLKLAEIGSGTGISVRVYNDDWPSVDVLAAVTGSPETLLITRAAGQSIFIQSAIIGMSGTLTTPYDTNVTVALRYAGADEPIYTCQVLDRTVVGIVNMSPNVTPAIGSTVILGDADLEWYVDGGAALNGTGDLVIIVTYLIL